MSEEKKGFFSRLKAGLTKTRENIVRGIDSLFSGFSAIDEDFYEEDLMDVPEEMKGILRLNGEEGIDE